MHAQSYFAPLLCCLLWLGSGCMSIGCMSIGCMSIGCMSIGCMSIGCMRITLHSHLCLSLSSIRSMQMSWLIMCWRVQWWRKRTVCFWRVLPMLVFWTELRKLQREWSATSLCELTVPTLNDSCFAWFTWMFACDESLVVSDTRKRRELV